MGISSVGVVLPLPLDRRLVCLLQVERCSMTVWGVMGVADVPRGLQTRAWKLCEDYRPPPLGGV